MSLDYVYYFTLLLGLLLAEWAYVRYAGPYIQDIPVDRSSHVHPTVRGGGVIFYLAALVYFVYSHFSNPIFFAGFTLISVISFWDDVKGMHQVSRLVMHLIAISLALISIDASWQIWSVGLFVVLAIGVVNAYNFMDGINGITAAYSLIVLGVLYYLNIYGTPFVEPGLMRSVLVAVLVFFLFNFRKRALCFAGDVGAVSMAFIMVYLIGSLILKTGQFAYILLIAVYGVDTVGTIVERILKKENILEAHRAHLYQLLVNEKGWPHLLVSVLYAIVQLMIGCLVIVFSGNDAVMLGLLVGVLVLLAAIFLWVKIRVFKVFQTS